MEKVHIFTHDDLDGIVSAAMYKNYFQHDNPCRIRAVPSGCRGERFNRLIDWEVKEGDKLVVLDFEIHHRANLWIDHHFEHTIGSEPVYGEKVVYDPRARSAAELVYKYIDDEDFTSDYLADVSKIDINEYESVEEIFTSKTPMMQLRAEMEMMVQNDHALARIAETISACEMCIEDALWILGINHRTVDEVRNEAGRCRKFMTSYGDVVVLSQIRPNQFPRYSEYLMAPNAKYSIRTTKAPNDRFQVQVGANKWAAKNDVNIGKMMSSLKSAESGGGHFNVGGGRILASKYEDAITEILSHLNDGADVEKYAVDKNDPVEKRAREMVKNAGVKINEARDMASKVDGEPESDDGPQG